MTEPVSQQHVYQALLYLLLTDDVFEQHAGNYKAIIRIYVQLRWTQ
jgi:hypothetical protein